MYIDSIVVVVVVVVCGEEVGKEAEEKRKESASQKNIITDHILQHRKSDRKTSSTETMAICETIRSMWVLVVLARRSLAETAFCWQGRSNSAPLCTTTCRRASRSQFRQRRSSPSVPSSRGNVPLFFPTATANSRVLILLA